MTHHQLNVGDKAPKFTLKNQINNDVTPMTLDNRKILLSFHPLAWTSVCEIQMRTLELKYNVFNEMNVTAYGISVDSAPCKEAWARVIDIRETNLLADFWPHGGVADQYGLFIKDKGISTRANVLIGLDRRIEWIKVYDIPEIPDIEEVVHIIKAAAK